jgi:hypothetical protein
MLSLSILGVWGLLAYMTYQYVEFGDVLAFAKTQSDFRMRPDFGLADKLAGYAGWEPFWSVYVNDSPCCWRQHTGIRSPLISLRFFNPIILTAFAICIVIGIVKKWLTSYEILLSIGLLSIPYVTRGYEMCMISQARFATVCFPVYIVFGEVLRRASWPVIIVTLTLFAIYLAVFAWLFSAGYDMF